MAAFLETHCVLGPQHWVANEDLYHVYTVWADRSGEHVQSQRTFLSWLDERDGITPAKEAGGKWRRGRRGIALTAETRGGGGGDDDDSDAMRALKTR